MYSQPLERVLLLKTRRSVKTITQNVRFTGHGAPQLFRIEGLYPPRHPVTVSVQRTRQKIRPVCVTLMSQFRNQVVWSSDIFHAFCCACVVKYVAAEEVADFGMRCGKTFACETLLSCCVVWCSFCVACCTQFEIRVTESLLLSMLLA